MRSFSMNEWMNSSAGERSRENTSISFIGSITWEWVSQPFTGLKTKSEPLVSCRVRQLSSVCFCRSKSTELSELSRAAFYFVWIYDRDFYLIKGYHQWIILPFEEYVSVFRWMNDNYCLCWRSPKKCKVSLLLRKIVLISYGECRVYLFISDGLCGQVLRGGQWVDSRHSFTWCVYGDFVPVFSSATSDHRVNPRILLLATQHSNKLTQSPRSATRAHHVIAPTAASRLWFH